nr:MULTISPECIES: hypothetical protein [Kocuria]
MIAGQGLFVVGAGIAGEDRGDGLLGCDGRGVVVFEGDAVEQGLVEHPSFGWFGLGVEVSEVGEDGQDRVESDLGFVVGCRQFVEPGGDGVQAGADAVLLGLEQVDGDRVGVVSLQELDLFGFELGLLGGEAGAFVAGRCGKGVEHLPQDVFDPGCVVVGDADALVGGFDPVFDVAGQERGAAAIVLLEPASGAGEVVVGDALVVAGAFEHEPFPAGAVDRAFEVVVVLLRLVADQVVLSQDCLHLLERLRGHERLMCAGVGDVSEGDDALVVRVGEDLVQQFRRDRPGGERRRGPGGEASGFQLCRQRREGVVAGRIPGERVADQVGSVGVGLDGADLVPEPVGRAHVEVSDGCLVRGAADRRFLHEALGDFLGEVQGVELRDRGHDAVHEHPGGGLVDVLGDGHERDTGLAERGVDDRVIEPVACDPVDLVDDAVPDRVVREVVQHLLQRFALRGLRGLAWFDELLDDDRAELIGLPRCGLALRGDGQAFFEPVAGGLVLGGDPQVGDRGDLAVGQRHVGRLGELPGERTQGLHVQAGREVEERHDRDCLSGSHSPREDRDECAGAVGLSQERVGRPAEPRRVRATGGVEPVAPVMGVQVDSTGRRSAGAGGKCRRGRPGCSCRRGAGRRG